MIKKTSFNFTVGQLIEILKAMPSDLPVLTSGYESGFEHFYRPEIINLKHHPDNPYFEGEFQVADEKADEKDTDTFNAVILHRVLRDD